MMENKKEEVENYLISGKRGKDFKVFIQSLLELSNLKSKNISILTNKDNLKLYERAFTHSCYHPDENYEFYELLGDVTCNKIIVWYLKDRFPFLNNSQGVKVIARLRINLVSGKNFSNLAEKLGFENFISYDYETKLKEERSVLEDCFEAFFGLTELLINEHFPNAGYSLCYSILSNILDKEKISISYIDLYDSITRLKETFDYYNSNNCLEECPYIWGNIKFDSKKDVDSGLQNVRLLQRGNGKEQLLTQGEGRLLDETKQKLCQQYLEFLHKEGFRKPIPPYYEMIERLYQKTKN